MGMRRPRRVRKPSATRASRLHLRIPFHSTASSPLETGGPLAGRGVLLSRMSTPSVARAKAPPPRRSADPRTSTKRKAPRSFRTRGLKRRVPQPKKAAPRLAGPLLARILSMGLRALELVHFDQSSSRGVVHSAHHRAVIPRHQRNQNRGITTSGGEWEPAR
jgi:hypothetical protein